MTINTKNPSYTLLIIALFFLSSSQIYSTHPLLKTASVPLRAAFHTCTKNYVNTVRALKKRYALVLEEYKKKISKIDSDVKKFEIGLIGSDIQSRPLYLEIAHQNAKFAKQIALKEFKENYEKISGKIRL